MINDPLPWRGQSKVNFTFKVHFFATFMTNVNLRNRPGFSRNRYKSVRHGDPSLSRAEQYDFPRTGLLQKAGMSSSKNFVGHATLDGSGRDSYMNISARPGGPKKTLPSRSTAHSPTAHSPAATKGLASSVPFLNVFLPDSGNPNAVHQPRGKSYAINSILRCRGVSERFDTLHQWRTTDLERQTVEQRIKADRLGFKRDPARAAPPPRTILARTCVQVLGRKAPQAADGDASAARRDATRGERSQSAMGAPRTKLWRGEGGATELGSARPRTSMSAVEQDAGLPGSVSGGRRMPPLGGGSGKWVWVRVAKDAPRGSKSLDASGRPLGLLGSLGSLRE